MAIARMTAADVLAVNSAEEVIGVIVEKQAQYPEWQVFPASPIEKISYKTLVRTAIPTVGFRAVNVGREHQKATLEARTVECKYLDASWSLDNQAATGVEWGQERAFEIQRAAHLEAEMRHVARQVYYGTSADAGGFAGLTTLAPYTDSTNVVDAGGTTAGTGSSVWLLGLGIDKIQFAFGMNGTIAASEVYKQKIDPAGDGKMLTAWLQDIEGYVGLQLTNQAAAVRIANLTADSGKGLTDDLLYEAIMKFVDLNGVNPDAVFMANRSMFQLRTSRTATNATGAPAPLPTSIEGVNGNNIPLYVTNAIDTTEALIEGESS